MPPEGHPVVEPALLQEVHDGLIAPGQVAKGHCASAHMHPEPSMALCPILISTQGQATVLACDALEMLLAANGNPDVHNGSLERLSMLDSRRSTGRAMQKRSFLSS